MGGEELKIILCRLEAGMVLSVPDEWLERTIPGGRAARARIVDDIARHFHCVVHHDVDGQRFERLGFPATG